MTIHTRLRKAAATAMGLGLALLLAACFVVPGQFASTLDLRKDGTFTYAYKGEIFLLGMRQLAEMASEADAKAEFAKSPCYNEQDSDEWVERDCTAAELEQQRSDWESAQQKSGEESKRQAEAFSTMFGGVDPSDPQSAEDIADRLRRQQGWNKVEYKGNGLFEVDFSITSRLTHDFSFPTMEGFAMSNGFVNANLRDGNVVRIDAPGFVSRRKSTDSSAGILQLVSVFGTPDGGAPDELGKYPPLLGSFTITTDASILANNTDDGAQAAPNGQVLNWKVSDRSDTVPMALIQLGD